MTRAKMIEYLENALKMFVIDPPDSDFHDGYLAAMREAYTQFTKPGERNDALLRAVDKVE